MYCLCDIVFFIVYGVWVREYWVRNLGVRVFCIRKIGFGEFVVFFFCIIVVYSFKLSRNYVDWYSMDEVYFYSDVIIFKIARIVI